MDFAADPSMRTNSGKEEWSGKVRGVHHIQEKRVFESCFLGTTIGVSILLSDVISAFVKDELATQSVLRPNEPRLQFKNPKSVLKNDIIRESKVESSRKKMIIP
jgi:hypothetical protein